MEVDAPTLPMMAQLLGTEFSPVARPPETPLFLSGMALAFKTRMAHNGLQ
jgi:hypothetical protein